MITHRSKTILLVIIITILLVNIILNYIRNNILNKATINIILSDLFWVDFLLNETKKNISKYE